MIQLRNVPIFVIIIVFIILLFYLLGQVKSTYPYYRKRFKFLVESILNTKDCNIIRPFYFELTDIIRIFKNNYMLDIHKDYYFSYRYTQVTKHIETYCPNIFECEPIPFNDIACNVNDKLMFMDYYDKHIRTGPKDPNIEFHDIEKQNEKYKYPCSINVYSDDHADGYVFDINHTMEDGVCKRKITDWNIKDTTNTLRAK